MLRIPTTLTMEEQEKLIKVPNKRYWTGHRNRTLLRFLLDSGLRISEATNLTWQDLDLQTGKTHVRRGKGCKDRILWLNDACLDALRSWRERQLEKTITGHVFSTAGGAQLAPRYCQAMIARYAVKAAIDKRITPHTLRHTFATDLLRDTKNLRIVQKTLGHVNLNTTQIYTHIVDDELEAALRSFRA